MIRGQSTRIVFTLFQQYLVHTSRKKGHLGGGAGEGVLHKSLTYLKKIEDERSTPYHEILLRLYLIPGDTHKYTHWVIPEHIINDILVGEQKMK